MGIEAISELVAVLLVMSLATERLVLAIRTPDKLLWLIPLGKWLNDEEKEGGYKVGSRRLVIQLLSFLCALAAVGWLVGDGSWNVTTSISIGEQAYPPWLLAILASGGSSFWKNILGYTKAVRDIRIEAKKQMSQV